MVVRHNATARRVRAGGNQRVWLLVVGAVVAMLAAMVYLALPKVQVTKNGVGLAHIALSGLEAHITNARVSVDNRTIPLVDHRGALVPKSRVVPNTPGHIAFMVHGAGFLSFLPWNSQSVEMSAKTPPRPQLMHRTVQRWIGAGLTIRFRSPVSSVQYQVPGESSHYISLNVPQRSVRLPLGPAQPSSQGRVEVWARSRSWEFKEAPMTVKWVSAAYVTASAVNSTVTPTGQLVVRFSQNITRPNLRNWTLAPNEAGTWKQLNSKEFAFTPSQPDGYGPGALVELTIPRGAAGPRAQDGSWLGAPAFIRWTTPPGSVMRLQQLLAQEGYLPVKWSPSRPVANPTLSYENSSVYNPPGGQFQWLYPNLPSALQAQWIPGQMSPVTQGAIMQFEAVNGLPVDGIAGPAVWKTLIQDQLEGKTSPYPYTYISVTETLPETLELWVGNKLFLTTKTNTGISATPTYLGTFPIYERLPFQIMRGKNPNGVPYADPVYHVNYFQGGDAVHGFVRASYGFPQSLGCVEVPPPVAQTIYHQVHYGTLVTVNPVGVAPAPAH